MDKRSYRQPRWRARWLSLLVFVASVVLSCRGSAWAASIAPQRGASFDELDYLVLIDTTLHDDRHPNPNTAQQRSSSQDEDVMDGRLVAFTPNAVKLYADNLAFINCDASGYGEDDGTSQVVNAASLQKPRAIILYLLENKPCRISRNEASNVPVFAISDSAAYFLHHALREGRPMDVRFRRQGTPALLVERQSYSSNYTTAGQNHGPHNSNNSALGSQTQQTSVALIILYSITGVITFLFLVIIVTGAVRAHRHPERYGPRPTGVTGDPPQSRAKGLARAVLDTIPIIKFGEPKTPAKAPDIEMQVGDPLPPTAVERTQVQDAESPTPLDPPHSAVPEAFELDEQQSQCPVCMEDFQEGQDLRVLPCDHQFHPDCIDPWLLNISGSCPLCRIDLDIHFGGGDEPEPDSTEPEPVSRRRPTSFRFSRYLDIARASSGHARMEALRQLQEENRLRPDHPHRRSMVAELGIGRLRRALARRSGVPDNAEGLSVPAGADSARPASTG